jgi:hypothetical protein
MGTGLAQHCMNEPSEKLAPRHDGAPRETIEHDCHDIIPYAGFDPFDVGRSNFRRSIDLQARKNGVG